jgi:hypothetical protein
VVNIEGAIIQASGLPVSPSGSLAENLTCGGVRVRLQTQEKAAARQDGGMTHMAMAAPAAMPRAKTITHMTNFAGRLDTGQSSPNSFAMPAE